MVDGISNKGSFRSSSSSNAGAWSSILNSFVSGEKNATNPMISVNDSYPSGNPKGYGKTSSNQVNVPQSTGNNISSTAQSANDIVNAQAMQSNGKSKVSFYIKSTKDGLAGIKQLLQ